MAESELLQQVEANLKRGIDNVRGSRNFYRRGSQVQTVAAALLSAATTLLIGLNQIYHLSALAAVSLVTAGLATIAAAWTSWFAFRKLWINNTIALQSLWSLRDRIDYDKALYDGQISLEAVKGYRDQLDSILASLNSNWVRIREGD
jgi:hypothetical protein